MEIIANKGSGKGKGAKCLAAVQAFLDERNVPYTVHVTNGVGHAKALTQSVCAAGADTVVALGGDGTLHEVLNGMDFSRARMGLVPAGRGNDFAIGTGVASLDPTQAIADIVYGMAYETDYIQINDDLRCLNVAGTGMDIDVLEKTANSKNKLSYVASLFRCLLKFQPYPVTVTANGQTENYDCIMVGVCNGTQFGGGIRLAPPACATDGKLDVIAIEKPKGIPTLFVMPKFVKGKLMDKPYFHHIVCDSVQIQTPAPIEADGEIYRGVPFNARVVTGGLKTFARKYDQTISEKKQK